MEQQTLFEKQGMDRPLASRMRPHTLEEFVGQEHLLGPVSYTHLDVYKRQPFALPLDWAWEFWVHFWGLAEVRSIWLFCITFFPCPQRQPLRTAYLLF